MEDDSNNGITRPIKKRRGRPSKVSSAVIDQGAGEVTSVKVQRRRGRPPKSKSPERKSPSQEELSNKLELLTYLGLISTRPIQTRNDRKQQINKNLFCLTRRSRRVQQNNELKERKKLEKELQLSAKKCDRAKILKRRKCLRSRKLSTKKSQAADGKIITKLKKKPIISLSKPSDHLLQTKVDSAESCPPFTFIETAIKDEAKRSSLEWMRENKARETTFFTLRGGQISPVKRIYTATKPLRQPPVLTSLKEHTQSTIHRKLLISSSPPLFDRITASSAEFHRHEQRMFSNKSSLYLAGPSTSGTCVSPLKCQCTSLTNTENHVHEEKNSELFQTPLNVTPVSTPTPFDPEVKTKDKDPTGTKRKCSSRGDSGLNRIAAAPGVSGDLNAVKLGDKKQIPTVDTISVIAPTERHATETITSQDDNSLITAVTNNIYDEHNYSKWYSLLTAAASALLNLQNEQRMPKCQQELEINAGSSSILETISNATNTPEREALADPSQLASCDMTAGSVPIMNENVTAPADQQQLGISTSNEDDSRNTSSPSSEGERSPTEQPFTASSPTSLKLYSDMFDRPELPLSRGFEDSAKRLCYH